MMPPLAIGDADLDELAAVTVDCVHEVVDAGERARSLCVASNVPPSERRRDCVAACIPAPGRLWRLLDLAGNDYLALARHLR